MLGQLGQFGDYAPAEPCEWCEKAAEGLTVEFTKNFLQEGHLCFKCFQQAVRVHHKQNIPKEPARTKKEAA